jgi:hypothetical protein
LEQKMNTDLQSLTIRLLDLADRAAQIAKGLDKQRTVRHGGSHGHLSIERPARSIGVMAPNAAAVTALSRISNVCREFESAIKTAIAALPPGMRS